MKRILIFFAAIAISLSVYSQSVTIDLKDLTQDQKEVVQKISKDQQKTEHWWDGLGKEIGEATNGILAAFKDNAVELSKEDLGKEIMFLVTWKLLWMDVIRIIFGIFTFIMIHIFVGKSYFSTFKRRILDYDDGKKKKWEYTTKDNQFWEYPNSAAFVHALIYFSGLGVTALIFFA
jgi:hypothetical protein